MRVRESENVGGSVYARVEEIDIAERLVFLDCVSTESTQLQQLLEETHEQLRRRWRCSFGLIEEASNPSMTILNDVPAAIVAVRVLEVERWQDIADSSAWLRVQFRGPAFIPGEPPTISAEDFEEVPPREANKLSAILDMTYWPRVPAPRLSAILDALPAVAGAVVHDVGQGSANALFDDSGKAAIYFDTGRAGKAKGGVARGGAKVPSAPAGLQLCACGGPLVVLSHWDVDHWAAAEDAGGDLLKSNWVVPSQVLGGKHAKFAARILHSGGSIFVVKRSSKPKSIMAGSQNVYIKYGKGRYNSARYRNDSGLVLTVHINAPSGRQTLFFPGDAKYSMCDVPPPEVDLLVASHHGADPGGQKRLPGPKDKGRSRLVYSFGHPNKYKHPTKAATLHHQNRGWTDNALNHSGQNQSSSAGIVRATFSMSENRWQSIVFPVSSLPVARRHFGKVHNEVLSS